MLRIKEIKQKTCETKKLAVGVVWGIWLNGWGCLSLDSLGMNWWRLGMSWFTECIFKAPQNDGKSRWDLWQKCFLNPNKVNCSIFFSSWYSAFWMLSLCLQALLVNVRCLLVAISWFGNDQTNYLSNFPYLAPAWYSSRIRLIQCVLVLLKGLWRASRSSTKYPGRQHWVWVYAHDLLNKASRATFDLKMAYLRNH